MTGSSNGVIEKADSLLTEGEKIHLRWDGTLQYDEYQESASFIVTSDRLLYSKSPGHFKDLSLQNIESVEASTDSKKTYSGAPPSLYYAAGGLFCVLGLFAAMAGGFSALAVLAGIAFCIFGGRVIWYAKENHRELEEEHEIVEDAFYHVQLDANVTSTLSEPLHIQTSENIAPQLSKLVTEAH